MAQPRIQSSNALVQQIQNAVRDALVHLQGEQPAIHHPNYKETASPENSFRDRTMTHSFSELVYVARGEADILMEDQALPSKAGTFLIIPSHIRHAAGACSFWERAEVEHCSSDTLWLIAYPSGVRLHFAYSRGEDNTASAAVFVPDRHLIVLLELLVDETKGDAGAGRYFVKTYLNLIYSRLAHDLRSEHVVVEHPGAEISGQEPTPLRATPIERAVGYIDRNFDTKITLDEVAHAAYMSRAQLTRLFRRERGQSVGEYVTSCRLDMARSMLRYDSFSLEHVARISGFGNVAYMTRQFSRHIGVPPGEYRKNIR